MNNLLGGISQILLGVFLLSGDIIVSLCLIAFIPFLIPVVIIVNIFVCKYALYKARQIQKQKELEESVKSYSKEVRKTKKELERLDKILHNDQEPF